MALLGNLAGPSKAPYSAASTSYFSPSPSTSSSTSYFSPSPSTSSSTSYFSPSPSTSSASTNLRFRIRPDLVNPMQYLSLYETPIDLVKCERCEQGKLDSWKCLNCHIFLCLSCTIEHQQGNSTKDHQVVYCPSRHYNNSGSLSSSSRDSTSPPLHSALLSNYYCDIHGEAHKMYCERCIQTSCVSCNAISIRCHHRLMYIHEAIAKAKRTKSFFESEIDCIMREIKEGIQRAEISKMHNEKNCQLVQCDIAENYRRLQERVSNIMKDVINEKKEKDKNIEMYRGKLEMLLKKMKNRSQALREASKSENPWDVVIAKERAAREIRSFKQREMNILFIDENELSFVPPEDDILLRLPGPPEYMTNNTIPLHRPIFGIGRQVVVRKPECSSKATIIGGLGKGEGFLCRPWGVCCNQHGQIIVADRSNDRIEVFKPDGSFLRVFGRTGHRIGELNRPAGIAVNPSGHIVVADKDNHRIQVFTIEGEFVRTFGSKGSLEGEFNYPWDLACNGKGQVVVCDSRNHRIQLFEEDGTFLRLFGYETHVTSYKSFDTPRGVCFTPNGEIIVTDFNNHKLVKLDIKFERHPRYIGCEGNELKQFRRPQGVICDDRGNLIIADSRNDRVQVLDPTGGFLWAVGRSGTGRGEMETPSGICINPEGRVVVVDYGNNRVQMF